jgi:integrase
VDLTILQFKRMAPDRRAMRERSVLAGLGRFCHNEGLGSPPLVGEVVEAFVGQGLAGRAPSTKGTYRSVLRQLSSATTGQKTSIPFSGAPAARPYAPSERAELMSIALAQPKQWRRHSALALLALGVGAGLRPGEIVAARRADVVVGRAGVLSVTVGVTTSRTVAVRPPFGALLEELSANGRGEWLFHPEEAVRSYSNFVNDFCRYLVRDPGAATLSANRCRASFICDHLGAGTDLSVLLDAAGINEVESLLRYARHVPRSPQSKAALRALLAAQSR